MVVNIFQPPNLLVQTKENSLEVEGHGEGWENSSSMIGTYSLPHFPFKKMWLCLPLSLS